MPDIAEIASRLDRPFVLGDVGGRWGPFDAWRALAPPIQIVSFEADAAECERLTVANHNPALRYEPIALGAEAGSATLHITREPACSSLYPPDEKVIDRHPELEVARKVGETTVRLEPLDAWAAANDVTFDALKLDVQGGELDVLRGAVEQLASVVMLEVEVEFNPIYAGQPLFADVDAFLRTHGFELWRLGNLVHYTEPGVNGYTAIGEMQAFDSRPVSFVAGGGQLSWAHAWYVARDRDRDADRLARTAIAAHGFDRLDLANALLAALSS